MDGGRDVISTYRPVLFVGVAPEMTDISQATFANYLIALMSEFDYQAYSVIDCDLKYACPEDLRLFAGNLILKPTECTWL